MPLANAGDPARSAPPVRSSLTQGLGRIAKGLALATAIVAPWAPSGAFRPSEAAAQPEAAPLAAALRQALRERGSEDELQQFYAARGFRPLWMAAAGPRPEARAVLGLLQGAARDGLNPAEYRPEALAVMLERARQGGAAEQARVELALSLAYAQYLTDLRTPPASARLAFTDPRLPPPPPTGVRPVLEAAARAPQLDRHVAAAARMNLLYEELRAALAEHRANRASGAQPDATERLILTNMARLRGLPRTLGPRFIVVDAASATLKVYEDGQVIDEMAVGVGRPSAATPEMAGVIRYARFNPYWNLPQGMIQGEIAPRVLREGPGFLTAQRFEILSDWSPQAWTLDPAEVDWAAVARGERKLRVRQLPGPNNILGKVKLMLPNELGIYLHDTPDRGALQRSRRLLSAGCIRLADADRLTRWLLRWDEARTPPDGVNQRVDLPEPVPVYIIYRTVEPADGGVLRHADVYGRDSLVMAELTGAQNRRL
ncbi:L,D-transpeptidase family protein [Phenylobacterium sp.]|uniref:L,D-transpeptidase family protein n=1 Tax=Phenylobacterium sp. TaxID=1871053 RepID=UPI00281264C6|nr:L,D-transpeptidase family protein [Phenylobacterium sp.]